MISDNPGVGATDRSFGPVPIAKLRPMVTHLDETTFRGAVDLLVSEEPVFAAVIDETGPRPLVAARRLRHPGLADHGAAGFPRIGGGHVPAAPRVAGGNHTRGSRSVLRVGPSRHRGHTAEDRLPPRAGRTVAGGDLDLDALGHMPFSEARDTLLGVKGIGPWTADVYLLSALRFPDVFPLGDRALQVGAGEVLGMIVVPDRDELELLPPLAPDPCGGGAGHPARLPREEREGRAT